MYLLGARRNCAIIGVLFIGAVSPTCVDAQSTSAPANAPVNKPATKPPPKPAVVREVPFPSARGGPLQIPIEGLNDGISLVGAGRRLFGLCWAGGDPPYRVALQDKDAKPVLQKDSVDRIDLTKSPEFVDLQTGSYNLTVSDGVGARAYGRFTAVPASEIPGATTSSDTNGETLAQSSALLAQGPAFDYEAYLRLLALPPDNPEAQRMRNEICHRQFEATVAEASAGGFPETEIILADASDLSSGQFAGAVFYYAYLTEQGALLSEAIYEYETNSADTSGPNPSTSQTQLQQATTLFEYGITDDLAVGAEISGIFEIVKQNPPILATSSHWSDPTFLAMYRVANQADLPVTAFVRSSYSPAIVKNAQDVVDVGETVIREQDIYSIASVFDATYRDSSPLISNPTKNGNNETVKLGSDWRYNAVLQSQVRLDDRWSAGLALGYQFSYGRLEIIDSTAKSLHVDGIPYISTSASYFIIPDEFRVSLSYHHYFGGNDQLVVPGMPAETEFTRNAGTDAVSIVLSSTASINDIHL